MTLAIVPLTILAMPIEKVILAIVAVTPALIRQGRQGSGCQRWQVALLSVAYAFSMAVPSSWVQPVG